MKEEIEVLEKKGTLVRLMPDEVIEAARTVAGDCINRHSLLDADELHELSRLAVMLLALPQVQRDLVLNLDVYLHFNWDAPDSNLSRWFRHTTDMEAFQELVRQMGERHNGCNHCKEGPEPKPVAEKVDVYLP